MSESTAIWLIVITILVSAGYGVFFLMAIFSKPDKDYQQGLYFRTMSENEWKRLKKMVEDEDE